MTKACCSGYCYTRIASSIGDGVKIYATLGSNILTSLIDVISKESWQPRLMPCHFNHEPAFQGRV